MNKDIIKEQVKYVFTDDELLQISKEQAEVQREVENLEIELKDIKSSYKCQLDAKNSDIRYKSSLIRDGYEMRRIDVLREFSSNKVILKDPETGKVLKEREILPEERQLTL